MLGVNEAILAGVSSGIVISMVVVFIATSMVDSNDFSLTRAGGAVLVGLVMFTGTLAYGPPWDWMWLNLFLAVAGIIGIVMFVYWTGDVDPVEE